MSNRRKPRTVEPSTEWMRCPDCNSTVHEVWQGEAPSLVLRVEVEHSDTCPFWPDDDREVALMFVPNQVEDS